MAAGAPERNMKALILVGGFGTRLRPLTLSTPKPLVPFANKPIVQHQIEALRRVGVTEVVLAINYQPEVMAEAIRQMEAEVGIKITISKEEEPLGTGGPIALAREHLRTADGQPFFVFNSDVTSDYPLEQLLSFHQEHGHAATICVTKVSEPSKYGVVVHDPDGKINHFVEKPQTFVGNHINAGLYIFQPSVLDEIELRPTSIENEIFPKLADAGELYAYPLEAFWMDIGQPPDYLVGQRRFLDHLSKTAPARLTAGDHIRGNVIIHPSAEIGVGSVIGPDVVIGPGCKVGAGVRLQGCCLMEGVQVRDHAFVKDSIVGWQCDIGQWCRVEGGSVLGKSVTVRQELCLNYAVILPHKTIKESVYEEGKTIIM